MTIEIYEATLKHDTGTTMLRVFSLSGKQGAIQQITTTEGCPECAIVDIVKIDNDTKQQDMKAKTIEEAEELAKDKSLEKKHRDETVHIIYCNRTEYFFIDTDGLIRLWEQSFGYYVNGVYTAEKITFITLKQYTIMANWCSNTVVFEGEPEAIEQIQQLFKSMAEKQQEENCGQLPDFVEDSNGGYFFDIYQDDDVTGIFQYETKWSPNIEVVQAIAEHYNVNFTQDYEELSNCVCGRAIFSDKLLTDIFLDDEEFEQYEFDEETDTYHFEGEEYESDYEILETLLERKIENHQS